MAKLGYTWYPKDWGNSESVFELNLSERGFYRELIDSAMLNNNNSEIKKDVWCRKFSASIEEIDNILNKLSNLKLINIGQNHLFIQSCESRLNLVRGGSNGGKKSKPTSKPFVSLNKKNNKPTSNQIEIETKTENNIDYFFIDFENGSHILEVARLNKFTMDQVKLKLIDFRKFAELEYPNYGKFVSHFKNWIIKNPPKDINHKPKMSW